MLTRLIFAHVIVLWHVECDAYKMQSGGSGTRRSSKWDQMTNEAVKPSVAAAEVAAKLNAKLAAEGKLIQSTPPQLPVCTPMYYELCNLCLYIYGLYDNKGGL